MPPQVDATVNPEESSETIKNDVNLIQDKKNIVELTAEDSNYRKLGTDPNYKHEIRTYYKCVYFVLMHILAVCGLYLAIFQAKWQTNIWAAVIGFCALQASVLGAHRGFSHKSFKTKTPLKIVLLFFQVISGQKDAYSWARDHRVHHKFSDTDADPHNSERGIWFSHITWVLYKKHPLVVEKGKQIDMSDLESDKYIMFQRKYYVELYLIFAYLMPWLVPVFLWDEGLFTSLCVSHYLMYAVSLHCMLSINSIAHMYGTKPFDKRINPVQTRIVNWLTGGEGWHNFHHCFPWDYGLSEYGFGKGLSTYLIEFFAYCGLVYDLKKASSRVVEGHSRRHGDESHEISCEKNGINNLNHVEGNSRKHGDESHENSREKK